MKTGHIARIALFLAFALLGLCDHGDGAAQATPYRKPEVIFYRVTHKRGKNWWAATVATYCPGRMVEHPKLKQTGGFTVLLCHPVSVQF